MSIKRRNRVLRGAIGVAALAAIVSTTLVVSARSEEHDLPAWEEETSWGDPALSADGRTLTVKVFIPPEECGHLDRLEHTSSGNSISITAISARTPLCAQGCPISGVDLPPYVEASITFDQSIRGHAIVEGRRVAEHCSGEQDHPTRTILH